MFKKLNVVRCNITWCDYVVIEIVKPDSFWLVRVSDYKNWLASDNSKVERFLFLTKNFQLVD